MDPSVHPGLTTRLPNEGVREPRSLPYAQLMGSEAADVPTPSARRDLTDVLVPVVAVLVAVVATAVSPNPVAEPFTPSVFPLATQRLLAVWIPLLIAGAWLLRGGRFRSALRGLRIGFPEVVAALAAVVLCRVVEAASQVLLGDPPEMVLAFVPSRAELAVLAAVGLLAFVLGPLFVATMVHGVFQRRLAALLSRRLRVLTVVVPALLVVVLEVGTAWVAGIAPAASGAVVTAAVLALLAGALAAVTGRIGVAAATYLLWNVTCVFQVPFA